MTRHAGSVTLSAQELYRRGRAHLNAGQNAAARRALARAQERTEDPDLRARIAGSLAAVTIRQGEPETAERLIRDALAGPDVSVETAAMLHGQLGLLALERGDLDAAVSWLDRGISAIGASREHRTPMLVNRSVAHMQAGRLAAARADLELAAADYAAAGDDVERAMAVHNAGYVALLEGDLVPALALMSEARTVMERASAVNTAISDVDRAEVLRDAGLTTEAEQILERVARVFGANGMTQARGEAEFNLARSLITHDPAGAAAVAAAAARRFRTLGSATWAARAGGSAHEGGALGRRVRTIRQPDRGRPGAPESGGGGRARRRAREARLPRRRSRASDDDAAAPGSTGRGGRRIPSPRHPSAQGRAHGGQAPRLRGARRPRLVRGTQSRRPPSGGRGARSAVVVAELVRQPRPADLHPDAQPRTHDRGSRIGGAIAQARRALRVVGAGAPQQPAGRAASAAARSRAWRTTSPSCGCCVWTTPPAIGWPTPARWHCATGPASASGAPPVRRRCRSA